MATNPVIVTGNKRRFTVSNDEDYLRALARPEDGWVLSGRQWYTALAVSEHLAVSDEYVRRLGERGQIPGAILHERRVGWRLPRAGLITYLAQLRRHTAARQHQAG